MKEIVVISGKGGTGKTTFLGYLASSIADKVLADCDVDAPNLHLMLRPRTVSKERFIGSKVAEIYPSICTVCGWCIPICRFDAIDRTGNPGLGQISVNSDMCEGCALCARICSNNAIGMKDRYVGEWFVSETDNGTLIHGRLDPGAENSGRLVAMVKQKARMIAKEQDKRFILVDGPPGVGCPVISSLSGADLAVVVTEPTASGMNDLGRILHLLNGFRIRTAVVINRADINIEASDTIERMVAEAGARMLGRIPYDQALAEEMARGNAINERSSSPATDAMRSCRMRLFDMVEET